MTTHDLFEVATNKELPLNSYDAVDNWCEVLSALYAHKKRNNYRLCVCYFFTIFTALNFSTLQTAL